MLAKSEFLVNLWKDILKPNTAKDKRYQKKFF